MPGAGGTLPDLSTMPIALEATLSNQGLGRSVRVQSIPLSIDGLSPMQAARALRHCLSVFATGGALAVREHGFDEGLSGFVSMWGSAAKRCERRFWIAASIWNTSRSSRWQTAPCTITRP